MVAASCSGSPAAPTSTTPPSSSATVSTTTTPSTTVPASTTVPDLSGVQVVAQVRHVEGDASVVDVSTPRLDGLADEAVQQAVNETLADAIDTLVAGFAAEATAAGVVEGIKSELQVAYRVTLLEAGLLSVMVDSSTYISGAAHPFAGVDGYIFDLVSGARLGVDDLTVSRDRLRDLIRQAIADQQYGGYRASVDEFASGRDLLELAAFGLDPDGLIVAFDQYAVAAGAVGVVTVHLGFETVGELIPDTSPVGRLLTDR